jgi:putative flavoprotein involved in K+ transport
MTPIVNTVVVGGGQAGFAVSHYLTDHAINHVVLEQADRPADAWRNRRWDSFTLNTPRWQSRVPGVRYGDDDRGGFMPKLPLAPLEVVLAAQERRAGVGLR